MPNLAILDTTISLQHHSQRYSQHKPQHHPHPTQPILLFILIMFFCFSLILSAIFTLAIARIRRIYHSLTQHVLEEGRRVTSPTPAHYGTFIQDHPQRPPAPAAYRTPTSNQARHVTFANRAQRHGQSAFVSSEQSHGQPKFPMREPPHWFFYKNQYYPRPCAEQWIWPEENPERQQARRPQRPRCDSAVYSAQGSTSHGSKQEAHAGRQDNDQEQEQQAHHEEDHRQTETTASAPPAPKSSSPISRSRSLTPPSPPTHSLLQLSKTHLSYTRWSTAAQHTRTHHPPSVPGPPRVRLFICHDLACTPSRMFEACDHEIKALFVTALRCVAENGVGRDKVLREWLSFWNIDGWKARGADGETVRRVEAILAVVEELAGDVSSKSGDGPGRASSVATDAMGLQL